MANAHSPRDRPSNVVPTNTAVERHVDEFDIDFDGETRERLRREVEETTLPDDLQSLADSYHEALDDRNEYQWKWLFAVFDKLTLSSVPDRHRETVREVKTIMAMYNATLDDLAEEHDDPATFWELAKVAYPYSEPDWDRPGIDHDYAEIVRETWTMVERKLQQGPRYEEFIDQFLFGLRRALTSMDYSRLAMDHFGMSNLTESWRYGPQNLMVHAFVDTDLMFSPDFATDEYHELREMMYTVQKMWRIGNWIATWEREIREHDFSAGVVVAALRNDVVSEEMLEQVETGDRDPEDVIERIREADVEEAFLAEWKRCRTELRHRERDAETETVDVEAFADGMDDLMRYHLASRGQMKEAEDA